MGGACDGESGDDRYAEFAMARAVDRQRGHAEHGGSRQQFPERVFMLINSIQICCQSGCDRRRREDYRRAHSQFLNLQIAQDL